jgi:hypothetical protein
MSMLSKRRVAAATAIAAVSLFACSLIVPADPPEVKCASADPSACPSGMSCDLPSGRCIRGGAVPDVIDNPDVEDPDAGDEDSGDATPSLAEVGEECVVDGDCQSGLCGTSTILTASIISGSSKSICTTTCCSSNDCDAGFICYSGGTGGSYCVPAAKAKRSPPTSGGNAAGTTCGGNTQCRSGLCESGRCVDTCCTVSDCAAGTTCRVKEILEPAPSHFVWACGIPNAGGLDSAPDAGCTQQSQCKNDNCVGIPARCTPSCCTAAHCSQQGFSGRICRYGSTGSDQLKFCTPSIAGGAAIATACDFDTDCDSGYCDPELKKCAQICCTDDDCAARQRCKPSKSGTPFLRCVPL